MLGQGSMLGVGSGCYAGSGQGTGQRACCECCVVPGCCGQGSSRAPQVRDRLDSVLAPNALGLPLLTLPALCLL